ncbi:hypothetical protein [Corynebacterium massiliense]|nr:hypothetical protein [Corynebacterium massiliense]
MPHIQFDVLVPTDSAERVREVFATATDKLVAADKLTSASVTREDSPRLPEGVEEQLRENYRVEHDDHELENAEVYRYLIAVEGATGSLNQLAMVLSRFLTPQAVLPKDRVLLEDERSFEQAAIFPWTVQIF